MINKIKRKSLLPKRIENLETFCKILNDLPLNFRFKLANTGGDLDSSWKKITLDGATAWQKASKILLNSSFFLLKKRVFGAIEKEGFPIRQLYFPDKRVKTVPPLTKEAVTEQYYGHKRSLREIGTQYGCSKQNVMAKMRRLGLKRRTKSEARKELMKDKKMAKGKIQ